jgi:histidine triad (HIT) family protein
MPTIQGMAPSFLLKPLLGRFLACYPIIAVARGIQGFRILEIRLMMTDNLFKKIIDRQIPAAIVYEDDQCLAFKDINPQAPVHVLIIPRKVIPTHADLTEADRDLMGHLHLVAAKLAGQLGIADGYRLVLNCKERAGQTVPHLHLHLLGGRDMRWPPG